ncbi:MAG: hypothetical protein MHPSP_004558, partial [Paramarteilia canceri]
MVPEFLSLTSANSPTGSNRKASGPGHSESNQFLVQVLCRRRNTDVVCLTLPRSKIVIAIKRLKFHYAEKHQSPVNECF